MKTKNNIFYLDLIRAIAIFLVISVHFFWNTNFYKINLSGTPIYISHIIRVISMSCVPLFLLLTGYLNNKKEISKKYYFNLKKILIPYILISIISILYKYYYLHIKTTFLIAIESILDFSAIDYAWYVEMYIGLYLLIPFLNIIWKNLKDKDKKILIFTLLILTTLPTLTNNFDIVFNQGLKEIFLAQNNKTQILPTFWLELYPLTYYFIGCYLCDKKKTIKIEKKKLIFIYIICILVFASINYLCCYRSTWQNNSFTCDWAGYQNIISSILLFLILSSFSYKKIPKFITKTINNISKGSFSMYLLSFIFDSIIYKILNENISLYQNKILFYPIVVLSVFTLSFIAAYLINFIINKCETIIKKYMS